MIGQLNSQVTAAFDYINNYFIASSRFGLNDRVLRPVAFFVPHPDARGGACRSNN
jgi:hypothetical protein